jgi:hypothetical protein
MAKAEHPEKYKWWLNELDSLGINTLQKNGLDNHKDASGRLDNEILNVISSLGYVIKAAKLKDFDSILVKMT